MVSSLKQEIKLQVNGCHAHKLEVRMSNPIVVMVSIQTLPETRSQHFAEPRVPSLEMMMKRSLAKWTVKLTP
jgi:hypothetical protein